MDYLMAALAWLLWTLLAIAAWLARQILWILLWLVLPLLIVAFLALRVAESVLGPEAVRRWVKAQSMRFGSAAATRARRLTFALGALPLRVLAWFVVYTVWHAAVSLIWRPKWHPWQSAWAKRWKTEKRTPSGRRIKPSRDVRPAKTPGGDAKPREGPRKGLN